MEKRKRVNHVLTCHAIYSRESRPPAETRPRKEPRADIRTDHAARAASILDRSGEYQSRDMQAMKQAGSAMEQIHGGMSIEQVDVTMYVALHPWNTEIHLSFHGFIYGAVWADNACAGTYFGNNIN